MGRGFKDKEEVKMLTKCYFCGGKVKEEEVSVDFWWGEKLVIFENVPARVCGQCGEKFFSAEVYKQMEDMVRRGERPLTHVTVDVIDFRESPKAFLYNGPQSIVITSYTMERFETICKCFKRRTSYRRME